jgi:hypothetical protein
MKIRPLLFAAIFFHLTVIAFPQDPLKVAPQAYRLQFDNEWVKVTRVHYGPREKIPAHDHSRWPAAYVYLNNSGPIKFRHVGWDHPILTRPATKAGSFRLSPTTAVEETHEAENPTNTPSDFLRIEFKTQPVNRESLRGRFYRKRYPVGENLQEVQFENGQIRVTRLICARRKSLDITTTSSEPALLVILSSARIKSIGTGGEAKQTALGPGETIWLDGGRQERLENLGDGPVEALRFDLRTSPVKSKGGQGSGGDGGKD